MKCAKILLSTLLLAAGLLLQNIPGFAAGTTANEQVVTRVGTRPSAVGSHSTFTGNVRHDPLFGANDAAPYSVSYVTFEPGARTFWHTHPRGQRLIVMSGSGLTGTADGKIEEIHAGDVVWCPPNVKHWHGASPTTAMTHMALTGMKDGKNVTWMEEVTDAQYRGQGK